MYGVLRKITLIYFALLNNTTVRLRKVNCIISIIKRNKKCYTWYKITQNTMWLHSRQPHTNRHGLQIQDISQKNLYKLHKCAKLTHSKFILQNILFPKKSVTYTGVIRNRNISLFKYICVIQPLRPLLYLKNLESYRILRLFLLNYVSKSRDFLCVSRVFFCSYTTAKNLEILQSQVFLSLVSEIENVSSPKFNKVLIMRFEPHDNNT
jgi:hypothetical protein